jgi:hypothetical protein
MTAKHTPGPWSYEEAPPNEYGDVVAYVITGEKYFADVHVLTSDPDTSRAEADARLIAAAPELLAAVLELREWINNWEPDFASDDEWPDTEHRVRAVIAKATGDEA